MSNKGSPQYNVEQMNATFQHIPELAISDYGKYPMPHADRWLSPVDQAPNSKEYCFIPHPKSGRNDPPPPLKKDYVWGPGTRGFGYYHLLTKEAYVILESKVSHMASPDTSSACCGGGKVKGAEKTSYKKSDMELVRNVMFARKQSRHPGDYGAMTHAIQNAGAGHSPADQLGLWQLNLGDRK